MADGLKALKHQAALQRAFGRLKAGKVAPSDVVLLFDWHPDLWPSGALEEFEEARFAIEQDIETESLILAENGHVTPEAFVRWQRRGEHNWPLRSEVRELLTNRGLLEAAQRPDGSPVERLAAKISKIPPEARAAVIRALVEADPGILEPFVRERVAFASEDLSAPSDTQEAGSSVEELASSDAPARAEEPRPTASNGGVEREPLKGQSPGILGAIEQEIASWSPVVTEMRKRFAGPDKPKRATVIDWLKHQSHESRPIGHQEAEGIWALFTPEDWRKTR